jgi:hypothetical protein
MAACLPYRARDDKRAFSSETFETFETFETSPRRFHTFTKNGWFFVISERRWRILSPIRCCSFNDLRLQVAN